MRFPRVAKAQPWAGVGERFQRYSFPINLLESGYRFDFLCKAALSRRLRLKFTSRQDKSPLPRKLLIRTAKEQSARGDSIVFHEYLPD